MSETDQQPSPPPGVSGAAAEWHREMTSAYEFDDPHSLRLLGECSIAYQRLLECRAVLRDDGLFVFDRFGQRREHPAAVGERAYMGVFRLLCRELAIEPPRDESVRIPRLGGYQ